MNKSQSIAASLVIFALFMVPTVRAEGKHALAAGARFHPEHSAFTDLPFDDDFSIGLAYEYHNKDALWQFAVNYAPDLSGTNDVDYVIMPQLNLLMKDNGWRGGLGILSSYIESKDDNEWLDVYFQFLLGLNIPMGSMELEVTACYVFEEWGALDEFDFDDLDAAAWLTYRF